MPVLLAENIVQLEFSDLWKRRPIDRPDRPLSRSPGHHQSGVLRYIALKVGWLKSGEALEEDMPWRMAMGTMFEEFYFSLLTTAIWQPGEQIKDGIASNCDGINIIEVPTLGETHVIEETKCTEMKVKTGEDFLGLPLYMHQGREYCFVYGPRVVRWSILFYRGAYDGLGPVCKQYIIKFSDRECLQTHDLLLKYRDETEPER
jgi:hypothetical protein